MALHWPEGWCGAFSLIILVRADISDSLAKDPPQYVVSVHGLFFRKKKKRNQSQVNVPTPATVNIPPPLAVQTIRNIRLYQSYDYVYGGNPLKPSPGPAQPLRHAAPQPSPES